MEVMVYDGSTVEVGTLATVETSATYFDTRVSDETVATLVAVSRRRLGKVPAFPYFYGAVLRTSASRWGVH